MADKKYSTVHYAKYLELDKVLDAQHPRSEQLEGKAAHDEMLFIIIHQVYELWFKQMGHELGSVQQMFKAKNVDEKSIGIAGARVERVVEILKVLIAQIRILETMTPLDFLDFRRYLFPASGFQSYQFRQVEVLLGLPAEQRITYGKKPYSEDFEEEQKKELEQLEKNSLFKLIEAWLERTPFLKFKDFSFLRLYKKAVSNMLEREREAIQSSEYLDAKKKNMRLKMLEGTDNYFRTVLDRDYHKAQREAGNIRLSYKATVAALLINLYREEPILHEPFEFLTAILDMDEYLTMWRYRHAQMVMRMLGRKVGTGGSSGYEYLNETAKKHHIFKDFHNISTLLIPRSELPKLPDHLTRELGFYFTQREGQ